MNKNVVPLTIFDSVENRGLGSFLIHSVRDIFAYRFVLFNLVNTNLRARYRRSTMGFLWTLVNPLFTMTILSVVFSTIYKLPFADFGVYIFSGLLPWNLMSNSIVNGSVSLIYAEGYLKKSIRSKTCLPNRHGRRGDGKFSFQPHQPLHSGAVSGCQGKLGVVVPPICPVDHDVVCTGHYPGGIHCHRLFS